MSQPDKVVMIFTKGHYNLLNPEAEQVRVVMSIWLEGEYVQIIQNLNLDYFDDLDTAEGPEEVLDIIENALQNIWSSHKKEKQNKIAWARQRMSRINCLWAQEQIERYQQKIDDLKLYIEDHSLHIVED